MLSVETAVKSIADIYNIDDVVAELARMRTENAA